MLIAEFEIMGLPKMRNRMSFNWRMAKLEADKWKNHVIGQCESLSITNLNLDKAKLTFTRYSTSEPDFDGLVSGFKHVLDGLVRAKVIIDDKASIIGQPTFKWEKSKPKQGKIKIRIEDYT